MIVDAAKRSEIEKSWTAVCMLKDQNRCRFIGPSMGIVAEMPEEFYNPPLVLAYTVLEGVLVQLLQQGVFSISGRATLSSLMKSSRTGGSLGRTMIQSSVGVKH